VRILSGPIYEIRLEPPVAHCRVWTRTDIDATTGAVCAKEMRDAISEHVVRGFGFRGVIFDVREGPPAFGPKTQVALTELIRECAAGGRGIAFLVGDSAIQRMQFTRLQKESGSPLCCVFLDENTARAFVADA
jgi:hypothetical protein